MSYLCYLTFLHVQAGMLCLGYLTAYLSVQAGVFLSQLSDMFVSASRYVFVGYVTIVCLSVQAGI